MKPFISQIIKPIHNKIWALSPHCTTFPTTRENFYNIIATEDLGTKFPERDIFPEWRIEEQILFQKMSTSKGSFTGTSVKLDDQANCWNISQECHSNNFAKEVQSVFFSVCCQLFLKNQCWVKMCLSFSKKWSISAWF